jgi:hypothetical protein
MTQLAIVLDGTPTARAALDHELGHATGGGDQYRHWLARWFLYTEGVYQMAEKAGAHWLIDAIASHVCTNRKAHPRREQFQLWTLKAHQKGSGARLTMRRDTDGRDIVRQDIPFTDFPLEGEPFKLYATDNGAGITLMLPSEY